MYLLLRVRWPNVTDKDIEWYPIEPTYVPDVLSLVEIAAEKELEKREKETRKTLTKTSLPEENIEINE